MITRDTPDRTGRAVYSDDLVYRYRLQRFWDRSKGRILWVMLNPSTATEATFDPTVRRCYGYSTAWGYGSMEVVNLFALRATDPRKLLTVDDPVGPDNSRLIYKAVTEANRIMVAWGAHPIVTRTHQDLVLLRILCRAGGPPYALKVTKSGAPSHPLYLKASLKPVLYKGG